MGHEAFFHAPEGADFLGWRKRGDATEIVYDDGAAHRIIWRVAGSESNDARLSEALHCAVRSLRVVPALYVEMKKRAIHIERIAS